MRGARSTEVKYSHCENDCDLHSTKIFWTCGTESYYVKLSGYHCHRLVAERMESIFLENSNHRTNKICEQFQLNKLFNKTIMPPKFLEMAERGIRVADKEVSNVVKFEGGDTKTKQRPSSTTRRGQNLTSRGH